MKTETSETKKNYLVVYNDLESFTYWAESLEEAIHQGEHGRRCSMEDIHSVICLGEVREDE